MKMFMNNPVEEAFEFARYKAEVTQATMDLIHLYVEGLNMGGDVIERGLVALKINQIMDDMPAEVKDAVIIELMSSLVKAVQLMKKAGLQ
jgi:hypothetical protein